MKVLMTGCSGLIGSHLIDYLLANTDDELYGIIRPRTEPYRQKEVNYFECDITDPIGVMDIVKTIQPDYVYHLAGQAYFKVGKDNPLYTVDVNINGTINVLEAIRRCGKMPKKIVIACSAAAYGKVDFYPTREETQFMPLSLYGVSKATQDLLGWQYYVNYDLPICRTRSYIHIGTRQHENVSIPAFAKQIAEIEHGKREFLECGNLDSFRDFLDVRDAVVGFHDVALHGEVGEAYNICSNTPRKMEDILSELISLSDHEIKVVKDKNRMRPSDTPVECGSYDKLRALTGWQPKIKWEDTLFEILSYWREKVK